MSRNKAVLFVSVLLITACQAPRLTDEEASLLSPETLCAEYNRWSQVLALGPERDLYERDSVVDRVRVLKNEAENRNVVCSDVFPQIRRSGFIHCFPNEATGGITCIGSD